MADIDWTGVSPSNELIEPLNAETFVLRLRRLSAHVEAVERLRRAMKESTEEQRERVPGNPDPASR